MTSDYISLLMFLFLNEIVGVRWGSEHDQNSRVSLLMLDISLTFDGRKNCALWRCMTVSKCSGEAGEADFEGAFGKEGGNTSHRKLSQTGSGALTLHVMIINPEERKIARSTNKIKMAPRQQVKRDDLI